MKYGTSIIHIQVYVFCTNIRHTYLGLSVCLSVCQFVRRRFFPNRGTSIIHIQVYVFCTNIRHTYLGLSVCLSVCLSVYPSQIFVNLTWAHLLCQLWLQKIANYFKGTQDWEFFWLRFWNLRYFFVSYVKILRFYKTFFFIGPLLGEVRFFRIVLGLNGMKKNFELGTKFFFFSSSILAP